MCHDRHLRGDRFESIGVFLRSRNLVVVVVAVVVVAVVVVVVAVAENLTIVTRTPPWNLAVLLADRADGSDS